MIFCIERRIFLLMFFCGLTTLFLPISAQAYDTREEMRAAYREVGNFTQDTPYLEQPSAEAPYSSGALTEEALEDGLKYLNFLRELAGLDPVSRNRLYDYRCQNGATLLAALDLADHNPPQPEDMSDDFYESAHLATASSNLAKFNWMRPTMLREGLAYFVRDDGDANLSVLGHRRWLLNPYMAETGFGLANSKTGMSYVLMYAHDFGNADAQWSEVCWPAAGVFPVELMHADLAWSVSLNPEQYDLEQSQVTVELMEEEMGKIFRFDCSQGIGDGFCSVSLTEYGAGGCIIFRPDFTNVDFTDYQQNQSWTVRIAGLKNSIGETVELNYTVDMASLYVQEVANIELSDLEKEVRVNDVFELSAAVIPNYADDLTVYWHSSDETIAVVNEVGTVTALRAGACEIIAQSANGREDRCALTVTE